MRSARRLSLFLSAGSLIAAGLVPVGPAEASAGPSVTITSPAPGPTPPGLVTITATGDVDPSESDTPTSMALLVNGVPYSAFSCPPNSASCPTTFSWDSSGLNGPYTLQTELFTKVHPSGVLSQSVGVMAVNPPSTVTITSPTPNAVAKSTLTVQASGVVDLSQTNQPATLQLLVDGARYGLAQACTLGGNLVVTTVKTCTAGFPVGIAKWSGQHTVAVTMTTTPVPLATTAPVTSAVVPFLAYSATRTSLSSIAVLHAGRSAIVHGKVVSLSTGQPLVHAKVVITLTPGWGRTHSLTVMTGGTGHFTAVVKLSVNTLVRAAVSGTAAVGGSHATTAARVVAPVVCKVPTTVVYGRYDSGSCSVAHLPGTTKVSLQYEVHKKWHVLGAGTAGGATIPISFTFAKRGSYPMRLVLSSNKVYVGTTGPTFTVKAT